MFSQIQKRATQVAGNRLPAEDQQSMDLGMCTDTGGDVKARTLATGTGIWDEGSNNARGGGGPIMAEVGSGDS